MPISAGTRLGPYEVVSPLGAGGMGEVYRARDTKLGREVALKILPDAFATDPERLARFEREAQLLAALNHPHIATLHGLERAEASQFLVMELVDGATLAQRIAQGQVPLDEALVIARQVADALAAAHDKGIIHRDLKPSNIALTADGRVKVLDFGLAKALESSEDVGAGSSRPEITASPTLSLAATQAGVVLGTAAYMSPEQAKGRPADRRSDMWAFGCVLYEMLVGKPAFDGEDITDIIGAVVRLDPDWPAVPANVPLPVRTLLRTCLEKDRRKRTVEAATALFVLDNAASLVERVSEAAAVPGQTTATRPAVWRRIWPAAAAVIVTASLAGVGTWLTRAAPPSLVRTAIVTSGAAALVMQPLDRNVAMTPDGSRVVYRGNNQLLVRVLGQLEPTPLIALSGARSPFVSPDGQWVGFFEGNTPMRKVAITGGPAVTITPVDGNGPRGATWGPDGTVVYATNGPETGLQRVPAAGGEPEVLTKPDRERGEGDHLWPEFLPGGKAVLFTIVPTGGALEAAQIAVLDLETRAQKVVVRGGSHASYVSTGHLVYGAGGTLRAVPFDLGRLEATGTPAPVLEGVVTTQPGAADFSIASNGTMVYVPGGDTIGVQRSIVWVDRSGREEPVAGAPLRAYRYPSIAPDGTRVALDVFDQERDIWIWDFARRTLTRFTFDPGLDQYPVWTRDSRRVLFSSTRSGAANLFWQAADGTGAVERLTESPNAQFPYAITLDGSGAIVREAHPTNALDILLIPFQPKGTARPLVNTTFVELNGELSPDGRWFAYQSNDSGPWQIHVQTFPDPSGGRWQVSTAGGRTPLWSRNGRELFYRAPDGAIMGVRVEAGPSWRSTTPSRVLQGQYFDLAGANPRTYDISPDGRRFLMIKQAGADDASAATNLILVQNWHEELKRLVPVN